jgi:hypothetical protein
VGVVAVRPASVAGLMMRRSAPVSSKNMTTRRHLAACGHNDERAHDDGHGSRADLQQTPQSLHSVSYVLSPRPDVNVIPVFHLKPDDQQ